MATEDNIRKALTFSFTIVGLVIFYVIIMAKVKVMTQETEAKILKQSADEAWDGFLYQQTIDSVLDRRDRGSSEDVSNTELPE